MAIGSSFKLDQLFPELLSRIVYFLDTEDLKSFRLTNKSLDGFAKPQLFRQVFVSPQEEAIEAWNHMIESDALRSFPQRATIQSMVTVDRDERQSQSEWDSDSEAEPNFPAAVKALEKLNKVSSVLLKFHPKCLGRENEDDSWTDDHQSIAERTRFFELVYRVIKERSAIEDVSPIREMTIENLQNCPIDFPSADLFRSVMANLDQLHISMTQEYDEAGPDNDYSCIELRTFPPHFVSEWLAPISHQLKSLSLYSESENWGPFPGYFDFSSLSFPKLEALSLGYYTIAYDDQLDWVLAQKSLKKLVLQNCMIASDIQIMEDSMPEWNVSTRGWKTESHEYGFRARYPGRWSEFFDKIADGLPKLEVFRFDYRSGYHNDLVYSVHARDQAGVQLHPQRYVVFDEGILPTRWPEAENDGALGHTFWEDESMIRNFHEDHREEDQRSLDRLVQKCRERGEK